MAREAHHELVTQDYPGHLGQLDPWTMRLLERFAALVAEATIKDALYYKMGYADGVADEREAILQISCDQWFKTQADFEEAIRARSNT